MTPSQDDLRAWFGQFNRIYFGGELPEPRLMLSRARTRLGTMACRRVRRGFKTELTDFTIRVSTYYEQDVRGYQTVLLHEMIHYYIAYKRLRDDAPHGRLFRQMMATLNDRYGWNISVSTSMRGAETTRREPPRERLVLALVMRSGERWLSVVNPRYARSIVRQLHSVPKVESFSWFVSRDDFFRHFPAARSLRGRKVSSSDFDRLVAEGRPVEV